jgi:hypothetical protein
LRLPAVLLAATLAVGCSHVVDGGARPAAAAVTILPTEAELSDAVGNTLSTFDFQPFVGGSEIMPDGFRDDADASPFRCIGVTETMLRATYRDADVIEAARQSYFTLAVGAPVSGADAAVVRFGSDAEAHDRYRVFAEQWRGCDGATVVKHLHGASGTDVDASIGGVTDDGPVLAATVVTRTRANAPASDYLRAVGVRDGVLVEVSLAVSRLDRTRSDDRAVRAATVMLDKVGVKP